MTGRDEAFCLDVVQDAMMRVIKCMREMQTESDVRQWLRAVITSCAYDRLRAEKRRRNRELSYSPNESQEDLHDRLAWLRREMISLDPKSYPLIVLRFRFGWTLERIGQLLRQSPGAVDGRIRRALASLRQRANRNTDD